MVVIALAMRLDRYRDSIRRAGAAARLSLKALREISQSRRENETAGPFANTSVYYICIYMYIFRSS